MRTASDYTRTGKSGTQLLLHPSRGQGGSALARALFHAVRRGQGVLTLSCSVYYLPLAMLALATSVARPNLVSLGTCFGKFSKTGKFKLGITCLDWLAKYAKYKVSGRPDTSSGWCRRGCGCRLRNGLAAERP